VCDPRCTQTDWGLIAEAERPAHQRRPGAPTPRKLAPIPHAAGGRLHGHVSPLIHARDRLILEHHPQFSPRCLLYLIGLLNQCVQIILNTDITAREGIGLSSRQRKHKLHCL
jgi:hypothetical protein